MIAGLTTLLACQLAGELLARAFGLPVPGPVVGMVLLFAALMLRRRPVPAGLNTTADGLLANLGLLFVPAGVGVVLYLPLLAREGPAIALAVVGGTLLTIAATGRLAQALLRRFG
ncbi:holin-like protein [Humitalea rosea]|uniref:Holin-like protein n=1 Tax=Humitalea rosea TaxID=990373 RepID=A0A2W7I7B4_9PROT|nr:CidA/LrgA family protein [Humitalea rosea]PZW41045.1 holin-like protein [Humitalea rosea]